MSADDSDLAIGLEVRTVQTENAWRDSKLPATQHRAHQPPQRSGTGFPFLQRVRQPSASAARPHTGASSRNCRNPRSL